jgi:REP element-mobilizing transposase RayT
MPRRSRIDAFGALHHVIVRGIARKKIFFNDQDRDQFLERLGTILKESDTACLAWALIPNHFHLLLKSGYQPLSTVMRRLLTGYAVSFNRRHRRWGHLFQNRYKSILCQEEAYLLELTRYIHLNPFRAGLVPSMKELERYPYCGHGVILGKREKDWQDIDSVLSRFAENRSAARSRYRIFVQKGVELGKRPELTGGGLVRSVGGWAELKKLKKGKIYIKGDERILGDSDFVLEALKQSEEYLERKYRVRAQGYDLDRTADRVAAVLNIETGQIFSAGKGRLTVRARSLLCYWAVRECGMTMASLARRLGLSITAVSQSVARGEKIAKEHEFELFS